MNGWKGSEIDEQSDGWMDGWAGGRTNGQTDGQSNYLFVVTHVPRNILEIKIHDKLLQDYAISRYIIMPYFILYSWFHV